MQTTEVLRTIIWIQEKFEPIRPIVFSNNYRGVLLNASRSGHIGKVREARVPPEVISDLIRGIHFSGATLHDVRQNPATTKVLTAFGLNHLFRSAIAAGTATISSEKEELILRGHQSATVIK